MLTSGGTGKLPCVDIVASNRAGSTTTEGGCYALDVYGEQAEADTIDNALQCVTAVSASNINGILVIAQGAYADNAVGTFRVQGITNAIVDGDTYNVTKGDLLIPTAGSASVFQSNTNTINVASCGVALETNNGTATTKVIYFDGLHRSRSAAAS